MDEFLRIHKPSAQVLERAKDEGLDLFLLKQTNPTEYKMRVAQEILLTQTFLVEFASQVFLAIFPHHEVYKLEVLNSNNGYQASGDRDLAPQLERAWVKLLCFPELSPKDLKRWDEALAKLVLHEKFSSQYTYYRVIRDQQGEWHQLAQPVSPQEWQGETNVLVGPFHDEQKAQNWGNTTQSQTLMVDTVLYLERWFCDVFLGV